MKKTAIILVMAILAIIPAISFAGSTVVKGEYRSVEPEYGDDYVSYKGSIKHRFSTDPKVGIGAEYEETDGDFQRFDGWGFINEWGQDFLLGYSRWDSPWYDDPYEFIFVGMESSFDKEFPDGRNGSIRPNRLPYSIRNFFSISDDGDGYLDFWGAAMWDFRYFSLGINGTFDWYWSGERIWKVQIGPIVEIPLFSQDFILRLRAERGWNEYESSSRRPDYHYDSWRIGFLWRF